MMCICISLLIKHLNFPRISNVFISELSLSLFQNGQSSDLTLTLLILLQKRMEKMGWLWMASRCPPSCSVTPLLSRTGKENIMKGSGVKIRAGRHHLPTTVTGKTDLT